MTPQQKEDLARRLRDAGLQPEPAWRAAVQIADQQDPAGWTTVALAEGVFLHVYVVDGAPRPPQLTSTGVMP